MTDMQALQEENLLLKSKLDLIYKQLGINPFSSVFEFDLITLNDKLTDRENGAIKLSDNLKGMLDDIETITYDLSSLGDALDTIQDNIKNFIRTYT